MGVTVQTKLNRPAIPEGTATRAFLMVQLTGEGTAIAERSPLNVAAVVDRSGSMAGEKIACTKKALRFLVDQMDLQDYLSLISFDDEVRVELSAAHVTAKDALKAKVDDLRPGSTTNLSGGMIAGYREVKRHFSKKRVNRVLLMTDGLANVGVTDPQALVQKVTQLHEQGMQISTLGVGEGFNEDLLTAMAAAGGGNFYFIADPDQIPALFDRELNGLLSTVAQGLAIRFDAAAGVHVVGVIGYPPTGTSEAVSLTLPDIYRNEVKSLVLELAVEAGFAGNRPLGKLELQYTGSHDGADVTYQQDLFIQVTGESEMLGGTEDPDVMKQVYLLRSAEALDRAVDSADRNDLADSQAVLHEAAAPMFDLAMASGDAELLERARNLQQRAAEIGVAYSAVTRKHLRTESYQTRSGRRQDR